MALRDDLRRILEELPDAELAEVIDLIEERKRRRGPDEMDEETRAWMDADLSRLGEVEPYDWGEDGPPKGKPVIWDPEAGAFIVQGGKDEPK